MKMSFKFIIIFILSFLFANSIISQSENFAGKVTYLHSKTGSRFDDFLENLGIQKDSLSYWAIKDSNLVVKRINVLNEISDHYVKIGKNAFFYYPDHSVKDFYDMPQVTNYEFVKVYKKKEQILGYTCTKYKYTLNENTIIYFWIADDLNLINYGEFFDFISVQDKLVLKRQLIWENETNTYEAIKIDFELKAEDFDFESNGNGN